MGGGRSGIFWGFAAIKCAAIVVVRVLSGVSQNIGCAGACQKQKPRLDNVKQELTGIADVLSGVWVNAGVRGNGFGGFVSLAGLIAAKPCSGDIVQGTWNPGGLGVSQLSKVLPAVLH